jgi:hypothetical protein
MSHKSTDVKTPGIVAIAKKWKLPVAKVMELVNQGAEVEKEHNKSIVKARQVARDHINERPDYYNKLKKMEKTPVSVKEETGISGVRGLGYVTGDPGVDPVQSYIDINSMAYQDDNGNKLDLIKKKHLEYHNSKLGFNFFDPTDKNASNKTLKEAKHPLQVNFDKYRKGKLNELGGSDEPNAYTGLTDVPPRERKELVKEGPKLDKAKKVAMAGMTAANMYTMSDVMSRANEGGRGSPKGDIVKVASALPGAAGWGATAVHYGKKGYDLARDALKKKKAHMEEEKKMSNPCWKGYKAYGMKKKDGKEVPNCVPVEEQGSSATPYTERPTYESAAWQRKEGKNPEGGLNRKGIASYRRENPGSKLSMAVTTKPSKLDPDSKPAKRRKSFCARMGGMPGPMKDEKGRPTRKALSLRKWNCEEENKYPQTAERSIYEMDTDNMPTSKNIEDRRPSLLSSMLKSAHQSIQSGIKSGSITDLKSVETQASDAVKRSASDYFSRQNRNNDLLDKSTPKPKIDIDSYKGPSKPAEPLPGKPERMKIDEKAPPGAKYERMVRHIKDRLGADGLTDKEKGIAFATAWKAYNRKHMEEESDAADETNMAKTQLKAMAAKASNLDSKLKSAKNLPGWVQSKIAVAKDGITAVDDYMTHSEKQIDEDGFDLDAVTNAVRGKESRNDYDAKSKSSSASGAYQYINKTWKGSASKYGVDTKQFPTAKSAPKDVQDKVFTNDLQKNASKYGSLEKAVNVHYTGNPGGKVSAAGLKANRGQTGGGYMNDIKKRVDDYNTERKSTMGAAQQMAANFSGGSKSLSTPDSTQFAKAPEAPKPTQVASAPETPKMQNPDQNITKVASAPAPTQVSQLDTKDKKQIAELKAPTPERLGRYISRSAKQRKQALEGPKADVKTWERKHHFIQSAFKKLTKENMKDSDWLYGNGQLKEELQMQNQNLINEALENILENNLNDMKENLLEAINEKAMEKLEERKKAIAADYFAQ